MLIRRQFVMDEAGEGTGSNGGSNDTAPPPADDQLGDAGKKALAAERQGRKAAEAAAKKAEKATAALKARLDELEAGQATDAEKAIEQARKEAAREAAKEVTAQFTRRILETEVLARATGKLATPADAVAFLDLDAFAEDVDDPKLRDTIDAAIEELLTERPYLKAGPKVEGDADGGAKPPKPATDDKLTPEQRLRRAYSEN